METNEQMALTVVVESLRERRQLFFICWAIILGLAIAYAIFSRPVYRAELVLVPVEADNSSGLMSSLGGQLGQFASLAGINVSGNSNLQTHLALLESKDFTRNFIRSNGILPALYANDWDTETDNWRKGRERTTWQVLEDFERKVRSVNYDSASNIVRLRIDWYSGELASEWANAMGDQLNDLIRQRTIQEASDSIRYLQEELERNSIVGVEQSIYRLIESQVNKIMLANVRKEYAFQIIDPAIPPSEDAQLRPNRPLIIAIGLVLGFVFAAFIAVVVSALRNV